MKALRNWPNLALLVGALFFNPLAFAQNVTIDFEDQTPVTAPDKLEITTPDITVTFIRPGGAVSIDAPPLTTTAFGSLALVHDPSPATRFVVDFSVPIKAISFDMGHMIFGLSLIKLDVTAYAGRNAEGDVLEEKTLMCCDGMGFNTETISLAKPNIQSIAFSANVMFGLAYYDNFKLAFDKEVSDQDNDGIADDDDMCRDSDLRETVMVGSCDSETANMTWHNTGCTTSDFVTACAYNAKNHGHFVKCVAQLTKDLVDKGYVNKGDKGRIQRCAAHASLP